MPWSRWWWLGKFRNRAECSAEVNKDAAIVAALPAGSYTVLVAGVGICFGATLVEDDAVE